MFQHNVLTKLEGIFFILRVKVENERRRKEVKALCCRSFRIYCEKFLFTPLKTHVETCCYLLAENSFETAISSS
jgi:hypothetical protein